MIDRNFLGQLPHSADGMLAAVREALQVLEGRMRHIQSRRADLSQHAELQAHLEERKEGRVPAWWHPKEALSYPAWVMLFRAASLARDNQPNLRRILDFGSSVGELGHLFAEPHTSYEFIEEDEAAAGYLQSRLPSAVRQTLDAAPDGSYDCIFALGSLQRFRDYPALARQLCDKLRPEGILVISGAERWPHNVRRRATDILGLDTGPNVHDIEAEVRQLLRVKDRATVFAGLPLFRISVWRRYQN